jgi:natural product biosynthesis luciferase-like monooxygenase protein
MAMGGVMTPSALIVGEGTLAIRCGQILRDLGWALVGVATREKAIEKWADDLGLRRGDSGAGLAAFVAAQPFDYLFSIVNLSMFPDEVIARPRVMAVNFHDGPLPEYAGLNVTTWALLNREPRHAVTWHEMTTRVDAGRILKRREFDVPPGETAFGLNTQCYTAGMESFAELAREIAEGRLETSAQDLSRRRYFARHHRPPAAGVLALDGPAEEAATVVRALHFGGYANPLALAKLAVGEDVLTVGDASVLDRPSTQPAGTILAVDEGAIEVTTRTSDLRLGGLRCRDGLPGDVRAFLAAKGLGPGRRLADLEPARRALLDEKARAHARHEPYWLSVLQDLVPLDLPFVSRAGGGEGIHSFDVPLQPAPRGAGELGLAAIVGFLARLTGQYRFHVGLCGAGVEALARGVEAFFAPVVPLTVELDPDAPFDRSAVDRALASAREHGTYARDLISRRPELSRLVRRQGQPDYGVVLALGEAPPVSGAALVCSVAEDGRACRLSFDAARVTRDAASAVVRQLGAFLADLAAQPDGRLGDLSLVGDDERRTLLGRWDEVSRSYPADTCLHELFAAQAARTPDAVAVVFRGERLTYRELDQRANRLAHVLVSLGVGPDVLVGLYLERSLDLPTAVLAVLKAGGAYVPLDPTYPADRIAFMIADAALPVVLAQERLRSRLPASIARVVVVDGPGAGFEDQPAQPPRTAVGGANLAYVIYTSGSTGQPKGVMVEHRNVVNFGVGMDERLGAEPGVWVAVTSLSFDISVLELLWTLTRGFTVVIYADQSRGAAGSAVSTRGIDLSLFYFSSDEGENESDKYRLLLEGARFADRNGFKAVWTPERHFHAFGGLFPNPALTSAALATITERVSLRAGSCVSPLHHPLRVAEEWSVVDNLSKGRVAISFAAGWQPNDFVLRPESFARRKDLMFEQIETVRRLWRGEALPFPGPTGKDVTVRTLPRPIQKELPVWVTAAGNPETFEAAARAGANVLTHLLGQTVEEVRDKVALFRRVWKEQGHHGRGVVTLMLHTFVAESDAQARETVRQPMKEYLRSAVGLIKDAAWSFPTFKASTTSSTGEFSTDGLSAAEMDALLEFSFDRYYDTSGLFGGVATCVATLERMKAIDVDEIACLVDFGVPTPIVLGSLPRLAEVRAAADAPAMAPPPDATGPDWTLAGLIEGHRATHLQCTPSMAALLVSEPGGRASLGRLTRMMVGGEALPVALARELRGLVGGELINMYGPTETTIWSSTHAITDVGDSVPIGRPIANTDMLVLDGRLNLQPAGTAGELCIGGDGVVRGYLNRPQLSADRFVKHPYRDGGARLYRTGDLARLRPDGVVEFLGRLDHQVKIRGHRIELGEIETVLAEHPHVREAAVTAREDVPGDVRLVAYFIARDGRPPSAEELREHLQKRLPETMVPAAFVPMGAFPQTPNRKLDRKALPPPAPTVAAAPQERPQSGIEQTIAEIWQAVLNLSDVGVQDNFASLGGHSLLMVQVLGRLKDRVPGPVTLVDLFRYPTIRSLAAFLASQGAPSENLRQSAARAEARRGALEARRRPPR